VLHLKLEYYLNTEKQTYRISGEEKGSFLVIDSDNQIFRAEVKGKLRLEGLWPSVGDFILGSRQMGDWVLIEETINRRNALQRKDPGGIRDQIFAANVDYMFVVTSANLDLSLNRMDRYIAMAFGCGLLPIILLNKVDLIESAEAILAELNTRFPQVSAYAISAERKLNLQIFDHYLTNGQTAVFVGSSGVGKSSLANHLIGESKLAVKEIREEDSRGRHTTTSRSLHRLSSGAFIIDTPGIRVLTLMDASDGIDEVFADIRNLSSQCRFHDCLHQTEPGCRIQKALADGTLDEARWLNFLKLERESDFERRKSDKTRLREEKRNTIRQQKEYRRIKTERARR